MYNQYYIKTSGPNSVAEKSFIFAVADDEIKQIFALAENYRHLSAVQERNVFQKEQYLNMENLMMHWFYGTAITDSMFTGRPQTIAQTIAQLMKQLKYQQNTEHDNMYKIMQNITEQWALEATFDEFRSFILRFVRVRLQQKGETFDRTRAEAFALTVDETTKFKYSKKIVQHLFTDIDVDWFITSSVK